VNKRGAQRIDTAHSRYHGIVCPAPSNKNAICDRREQVALYCVLIANPQGEQ